LAKDLCDALNTQNVATFLDFKDIKPGDLWTSAIEKALREASGVVFLIEPKQTVASRQGLEWSSALEATWEQPTKVLIPLLLGGAEPPPFLRDRTALRVSRDPRNVQEAARKIAAALTGKAGLGGIDKHARAKERSRRAARFRELGRQLDAWKEAQHAGRAPG